MKGEPYLARAAEGDDEHPVYVFRITKGVDLWVWSCKPCITEAKDDGWLVMDKLVPPGPLTCDSCHRKAVAA